MCSECAGAPWSSALSACDLFPAHPFCPAGLPRTDEAPHLKAPSVIVSHGLQANSQDKIEEALSWEMLLGSKEKQSSPRRERNSFRLDALSVAEPGSSEDAHDGVSPQRGSSGWSQGQTEETLQPLEVVC